MRKKTRFSPSLDSGWRLDPLGLRAAPLNVDWMRRSSADDPLTSLLPGGRPPPGSPDSAPQIDFSPLNEIFDHFLEVIQLPIAIIDLEGRVLASSRWRRLCADFHRRHPTTMARCVSSDTTLSREIQAGSNCAIYRCANGLTDCATPIVIEGIHVANLFTGQFLLAPPDMDNFRNLQKSCEFDEASYFEALSEIPVVPQDKIPGILRLLRGLAQQIARHSLAEKQAHLAHAEIERLVAKRTQELQESEERFRAFMDHAPAVAWIKDDTGRFAYVSRVWEEHFGMSSAEIVGKTDLDLWPVKMAAKFRTDDAMVLESGCPIRIEEAAARKDGKEDYWLTYKFPLGERAGRRYVGGMALDISGRRKMEDDLREHRAHLEELVEIRTRELQEIVSLNATILATSAVGIAAYQHDGRCMMANPSFCRIVGGTEEQLLGQNFRQIESWTLSGVLEAAEKVLGTGQDVELETELTSTFGRHLWLRCHLSRFISDGDPHLLLMLHDVSEAKAAEIGLQTAKAEADHANNAKSRFLAAASHDLRQPLSAISLYTDTLAEKLAPADAQLARNMKDCIKNLNELLSSLLDLSRLDAHVVAPNIADFELGTVIQNVVAAFEPEAKLKGLPLRYRDTDAIGRTDPVLFKRIIGNLVSNAIRYTDRGGILIGFRRRHGKTWVEVWDTGIGIPADKTTEIFEEFRQLGNAERNRAKGTGLGLTIVAKTAALLGLQVRVRSTPGNGSLFAVELPQGQAVRPAAHRHYPHRPLRIALVEDNTDVATALVHALSNVGHQVVSATSRAELLPMIGGIKLDIAISDYRLAGEEDGIAVIGGLRAIFGDDLPALIITGDTDPAVIRRMAEQRISIQHKPLDLVALRIRIAELTA